MWNWQELLVKCVVRSTGVRKSGNTWVCENTVVK